MIPWFIWYFLLIILFRINLQSQEGMELPINYFVGMTNQLGSLLDQLNSTCRCAAPGCNGKRHKIFHPKCNCLVPVILLPLQNVSLMDENHQWSKLFVCLLYEAKVKWLTWICVCWMSCYGDFWAVLVAHVKWGLFLLVFVVLYKKRSFILFQWTVIQRSSWLIKRWVPWLTISIC